MTEDPTPKTTETHLTIKQGHTYTFRIMHRPMFPSEKGERELALWWRKHNAKSFRIPPPHDEL